MVCFTHTEAVANVPSRAATAHSITVPLRRYGPLPRKVQMARFFPVRSECQFDTFGKRRFADEKSERKGAIIIRTCPVEPGR